MPQNAVLTKSKAKKQTIRSMKELGVYRSEFNEIIDIYAELREQYALLTKEFMDSGCRCISETADGGEKKAPLVATLEVLRKDILQYSDRLMINPKANSQTKGGKGVQGSSLADVLKGLAS